MGTPHRVIIDDARPGHECLRLYRSPRGDVCAREPGEIHDALARLENELAAGRHAAGYFSYELGYLLEKRLVPLLPRSRIIPFLWFGIFDAVEIFEGRDARAFLNSSIVGRAYVGPLEHEWTLSDYAKKFAQVHEWIEAGDIYQANLSFRSRFAFVGDPMSFYSDLRTHAAAPYGAVVDDGYRTILSLSPELFFDRAPDGAITARPMKGTIARGLTRTDDLTQRRRLSESEKDRAENLMIVDLLRNDLGRISKPGSVAVENLFSIETYPTLHTMVSTVSSRQIEGTTTAQLISAIFPCGSVTGAPKIRAMEVIAALEASPRNAYCGAIGYFAPDGSARFNVAIRTITIKNGQGELGLGGAVVQDSRPDSEYSECLLKSRFFAASRKPVELIETLRWCRHDGFVRMNPHLDRMSASARVFGIEFDRAGARACLHDSVSGYAVPRDASSGTSPDQLRVRLTLGEDGKFSATVGEFASSKKQWTYALSPVRVSSSDVLLRHKTSWRELCESELSRLAQETGCDEVLFLNERGELAEGARSNIFLRCGGGLFTPPLSSGALDGRLRRELLDEGRCTERVLEERELARADEVFVGNSLRGLIPVRRAAADLGPRTPFFARPQAPIST